MSGFPCPWCGTAVTPAGEGHGPELVCGGCGRDQIIEYRYRLTAHLGANAVVSVYAGQSEPFGAKVVVVFLVPQDEVWRERFLAGYHAFGRIRHRGLARVLEVSVSSSPALYAVVEWIGESLEARISRAGPMPGEQVADLLAATLGGLADAHRNRPPLIHGGIHPQRIGFREDGTPALLSFEHALEAIEDPELATHYSAGYQAPELLEGTIGPAADVYALGVTAAYALTGLAPDAGLADRAHALQRGPAGLVSIISRMTERDPAQRYVSASQALADLNALSEGVEHAYPPPTSDSESFVDFDDESLPSLPPPVPAPTVVTAPPTAPAPNRAIRRIVIATVLMPVVLGVCGVFVATVSGDDEPESVSVSAPAPTPVAPNPRSAPPVRNDPPVHPPDFEDPVVEMARVTRTTGEAPANQGDSCSLQVNPVTSGEFNCRVFVDCPAGRIYGDGEAGYNRCTLEDGQPTRAIDGAANDGDPILELNLLRKTVVVSSDIEPMYTVWLELGEERAAPRPRPADDDEEGPDPELAEDPEPPEEEELPKRISKVDIVKTMKGMQHVLERCGARHGETGRRLKVRLSIQGETGKVSSAKVTGAGAELPVADCVTQVVSKAAFPRFASRSMAVTYTFEL